VRFEGRQIIGREVYRESEYEVSPLRRWLGDEGIKFIYFPPSTRPTPDEIRRAQALFPEAHEIAEWPTVPN
jgi:hypothetical protein